LIDESYWLFVFDSTHAAIASQRLLGECRAALVPTLRSITASCGMSLRVADDHIERAKEIMRLSSIDPVLYRLYRVEKQNSQTNCTQTEI